MKKYIILWAIVFSALGVYPQKKPKIKGSKNVIEVRQDLTPFNTIELVDDLDVVLQKNSQEGYALELDDNLVDILKFSVEDGVLKISSFYKITSKKKLDITVYFQELNNIKLTDGKITMKDVVSTDKLSIITSGSSKLQLNATANSIDVDMQENSFGDFNVASDSLNLILKDRIDLKLYATGKNNMIYMYKNAAVKLEGSVDFLSAKLYGNAALKAADYRAKETLLVSEDSPNAKIRVLESLQLSSKGASKTSLYGDGTITILDFLDNSKLEKQTN